VESRGDEGGQLRADRDRLTAHDGQVGDVPALGSEDVDRAGGFRLLDRRDPLAALDPLPVGDVHGGDGAVDLRADREGGVARDGAGQAQRVHEVAADDVDHGVGDAPGRRHGRRGGIREERELREGCGDHPEHEDQQDREHPSTPDDHGVSFEYRVYTYRVYAYGVSPSGTRPAPSEVTAR
jgi:hypothetical protein